MGLSKNSLFLFLKFGSNSNTDILETIHKFPVLSFLHASRQNPIVRFGAAFIMLKISYEKPIGGIEAHQVGLLFQENQWYYYDSMRNNSQLLKMSTCSPPSHLKNWSVSAACYSRLL